MHTIELHNGKTLYMPATLAECNKAQYIGICELLFYYHTQAIDYETFALQAVYVLLNLKRNKNPIEAIEEEKIYNVLRIAELVSSFFNEDTTLNLAGLLSNPVPSYAPAWKRFFGPDEGFQNVKFGEYVTALRLFSSFTANPNYDTLLELAATLYRPCKSFLFIRKALPDYDGDCRVPYNHVFANNIIKSLKLAPVGFVYGVFIYFSAVQQHITSACIPWGNKTIDMRLLFDQSQSEPENPNTIGMDSILLSLAENGGMGDIKAVSQMPLFTILIKLYDMRIRAMEQEKLNQQV